MELVLKFFKIVFNIITFIISCIIFYIALYFSFKYCRNIPSNLSFDEATVFLTILLIIKYVIDYFKKKAIEKDGFSNILDDETNHASRNYGDLNSVIELVLYVFSIIVLVLIGRTTGIHNFLYYVLGPIFLFVKMYFYIPFYKEYSFKTTVLSIAAYVIFFAMLLVMFVYFAAYFSPIIVLLVISAAELLSFFGIALLRIF